ncbi:MAG: hypothetical protein FD171_2254 [Actinobacteria bacterium]|nr:MAG: hypothetical protein FD171_2254 [Actinomycetota bacterium]
MNNGRLRGSSLLSSGITLGGVGVIVGVLAKLIDGWGLPVATDLVANLGLWILVVSLIGAKSRSRTAAVVRVTVFLIAMLLGYFGTSALFFDYMPWRYALGWIAVTFVLGVPFAMITWYSRGTGWLAACAAAVPLAMLVFSWLPYLLPPVSETVASLVNYVTAFNLVAGVALVVALPQGNRQRVRVLALAPVVAVAVGLAQYVVL